MWQFSQCTWWVFFCFCVCDSLAIVPDKILMYVTVQSMYLMRFLCMWQFSHCIWQEFYVSDSSANVPDEIFVYVTVQPTYKWSHFNFGYAACVSVAGSYLPRTWMIESLQPQRPNECRRKHGLVGLVVKASRRILGSNLTCVRIFSGLSHTSDLKIGTLVATLPGAWCSRVSAGNGRPSVSILWLGEMESLICNIYLSVAACKIVWADPSLRYTSMLLGC